MPSYRRASVGIRKRGLLVVECSHIIRSDSRFREVSMWRRLFVSTLIVVIPVILTQSMRAQQKPLTRDQVKGLVRDGLGDESGASEAFLQVLGVQSRQSDRRVQTRARTARL